jgi:hypothetical protein
MYVHCTMYIYDEVKRYEKRENFPNFTDFPVSFYVCFFRESILLKKGGEGGQRKGGRRKESGSEGGRGRQIAISAHGG